MQTSVPVELGMKYPAEGYREVSQFRVEKFCEIIIFIKACNALVEFYACVI
jgi:hypothetical protein